MTEETTTTETMTPEQIAAKTKELAVRENTLAAKEAFGKMGMPESLLEFVVSDDVEKQTKSIEAMSKAWNTALKDAVAAKLKGKTPEIPTPAPSGKKWAEMSMRERIALKKTNPAAYAQALGKK